MDRIPQVRERFPMYIYSDAGFNKADSVEELVNIIVSNQSDKMVTDCLDLPVLCTIGSFIDKVYPCYKDFYAKHIKDALLKAQGFEIN